MPRITITLTSEQHELYKALSKYTGKPMSSFLAELLETASPVLERTAAVFQRFHEQQEQQRQAISKQFEQVQDSLEPLVINALDQYDMFLNGIATKKAEDEERTAARFIEPQPASLASAFDAPTPYTNRGDTPLSNVTPKPARNKASSPIKSKKKINELEV